MSVITMAWIEINLEDEECNERKTRYLRLVQFMWASHPTTQTLCLENRLCLSKTNRCALVGNPVIMIDGHRSN